jgi:hypothetical protein
VILTKWIGLVRSGRSFPSELAAEWPEPDETNGSAPPDPASHRLGRYAGLRTRPRPPPGTLQSPLRGSRGPVASSRCPRGR